MAVDVFISYTRRDRKLREKLATHLSSLRNQGEINDWFDGDIVEGTEWKKELLEHLNTAQIILLLISADFIASKFCYNIEMKRALERHDADEARVIPIILRPCDWKNTPFAKLQAIPTDAKPVVLWGSHDEAFVDVVRGIKRSIKDLHDSTSRRADNSAVRNIAVEQDHQYEIRDTPPMIEPAPTLLPPAKPARTINTIGSISGKGHQVNQAETMTTYHYGGQSLHDRYQTAPLPQTGAAPQAIALANIQAMVNELSMLLDNQLLYPQEAQHSSIDPEQLALLARMINILVAQSISIPRPLQADIRTLCQRLNISPLI